MSRLSLVTLLFAFQFSAGAAPTANSAPTGVQIRAPMIEVGYPSNSGTGWICIVNETRAPIKPTLSATEFRSALTNRVVPGKISVAGPDGKGASEEYPLKPPLGASGSRRLLVQILGFSEAAEATAFILADGMPIGKVTAAKLDVPFAVKVDPSQAKDASLDITRNEPFFLRFKNDDNMTYGIKVTFRLAGNDISQSAVLPPNGVGGIDVPAQQFFPCSWNPLRWLARLTEGETADTTLHVQYAPGVSSQQLMLLPKLIPVRFRLNYFSRDWFTLISTIIIFIVLLMGGLTSLLLNFGLPKSSVKAQLNQRLNALGRDTGNLSFALESRARVAAAVTRKRFAELLKSQWVFLPDFDSLAKSLATSLNLLETRVALLQKLDACFAELNRMIQRALPPTLVDSVDQQLDDCVRTLSSAEPTEDQLKATSAQVDAVAAQIEKLRTTGPGQPDPDFAASIVKRIQDLKPLLSQQKDQLTADFTAELPGIFARLDGELPDPKQLSPDQYYDWDIDGQRLLLVHRAIAVCQDTSDPKIQQRLQKTRKALLPQLSTSSWDGLESARTLVREMEEQIDSDTIREALEAGHYSIQANRALIRSNESVEFCICFTNNSLNSAAARSEFQCSWRFKPASSKESELQEKGWAVQHYFAQKGTYSVQVTFSDWFGQTIQTQAAAPDNPKTYPVNAPTGLSKSRTKVEAVRLLVALTVALAALMTGARDQLMKADLLPGLAAVFALGFAADTIKNLLTQKQ